VDGRGHLRDVNHDGLSDLVLQFEFKIAGSSAAILLFQLPDKTLDGISIQGSDFISTVGCFICLNVSMSAGKEMAA
jgi:hypothetical protein